MKKLHITAFAALTLALVAIVTMVSAATTYTLTDVAPHNSATDCWSALNGDVYNLTSYIPSHPGGNAMVVLCGIDGTQVLASKHGLGFLSLVSNLKIGTLASSTTNTTGNSTRTVGNSTGNSTLPHFENEADEHETGRSEREGSDDSDDDSGENHVTETRKSRNQESVTEARHVRSQRTESDDD